MLLLTGLLTVSRNRAYLGALLMPIQSGLTCDLRRGSGLVLTAVPPLTQAAKPTGLCSVVLCVVVSYLF